MVQVGVSHDENGEEAEETIRMYTLLNVNARVRLLNMGVNNAAWVAHCMKPAVCGRSTVFCILQASSMT